MKEQNKLWKNYKMYPTDKNFVAYKKRRNEVNQAIRTDRDKQRKKIINNCKRNPKKFYGYMRKMQTVKAEVRQLNCSNGTGLTKTDTEAAEVLCEQFMQTFTKEEDFPCESGYHTYKNDDIQVSFDTLVVQKKLEKLKPDKS